MATKASALPPEAQVSLLLCITIVWVDRDDYLWNASRCELDYLMDGIVDYSTCEIPAGFLYICHIHSASLQQKSLSKAAVSAATRNSCVQEVKNTLP